MASDTRNVDENRQLRRVVPFVLTVVIPGTGHAYTRRVTRGALWLGLYLVAVLFLSGLSPFIERDPLGITENGAALGPFYPADMVFPGAILILCLVDLYLLERFT